MSTPSLKDIIQAAKESILWAKVDCDCNRDDCQEVFSRRVIGVDGFISALEKLEKEKGV